MLILLLQSFVSEWQEQLQIYSKPRLRSQSHHYSDTQNIQLYMNIYIYIYIHIYIYICVTISLFPYLCLLVVPFAGKLHFRLHRLSGLATHVYFLVRASALGHKSGDCLSHIYDDSNMHVNYNSTDNLQVRADVGKMTLVPE